MVSEILYQKMSTSLDWFVGEHLHRKSPRKLQFADVYLTTNPLKRTGDELGISPWFSGDLTMGLHHGILRLELGSKAMGFHHENLKTLAHNTLGEWHNVDQPNVVLTNIGI